MKDVTDMFQPIIEGRRYGLLQRVFDWVIIGVPVLVVIAILGMAWYFTV